MSAKRKTDTKSTGERPYTHERVVIHRVLLRKSGPMPALGAVPEDAGSPVRAPARARRAWLLARVRAVGRLARRLVGRHRYARRRRLVRDDPYTMQAATGTGFADSSSLHAGAPFRAYGSPHS